MWLLPKTHKITLTGLFLQRRRPGVEIREEFLFSSPPLAKETKNEGRGCEEGAEIR